MVINKKIKEMFQEISAKTIEYSNMPDKERRYLKRLLDIFNNHLSESEQLFMFKMILEQIDCRTIITDPDNIIQIYNIKLKTITYIFFLSLILIIVSAMLFKTNASLNSIIEIFVNVAKLLTI